MLRKLTICDTCLRSLKFTSNEKQKEKEQRGTWPLKERDQIWSKRKKKWQIFPQSIFVSKNLTFVSLNTHTRTLLRVFLSHTQKTDTTNGGLGATSALATGKGWREKELKPLTEERWTTNHNGSFEFLAALSVRRVEIDAMQSRVNGCFAEAIDAQHRSFRCREHDVGFAVDGALQDKWLSESIEVG